MSDGMGRPYSERPAARPAVTASPVEGEKKKNRLSVWKTIGLGAGALIAGGYLLAVWTGQTAFTHPVQKECVRMVAEWAGVDAGDVTAELVTPESARGTALDFRGKYPGGEWACGGEKGIEEPHEVVVYPADGSSVGRIWPM